MRCLLCFLLILVLEPLLAQPTTAMDWTKSDCLNGDSYHLFSLLDAGNVVVQEYVMMDCEQCVTAGNSLQAVLVDYQALYPGRIYEVQTGFDDYILCGDMTAWAADAGFTTSLLFSEGSEETAYYGIFGMPTILIIGGGAEHAIYYHHLGALTVAESQHQFMEALDSALVATGITSITTTEKAQHIMVCPNPVGDMLQLKIPGGNAEIQSIRVFDPFGVCVFGPAGNVTHIPVFDLPAGCYLLSIVFDKDSVEMLPFVKQ